MADNAIGSSRHRRRLWTLQTGALLCLVWLALDGLDNPGVGLFFAALGTAVGAWLVPGDPYPWRPLRLAGFFLYFLYESLRGGVDVAWRALHPRLPLAPATSEVRLWLPEGMPRTVMVSVVSLLPGTLSVDIVEDRLSVHALVPQAFQGVHALQRKVAWLFSLEKPACDAREGGA